MSVVLFVEGSLYGGGSRDAMALERVWNSHLVGLAGIPRFDRVVGISKKAIVALYAGAPPMSGAGEPLDLLLLRELKRLRFDAAVVAWDLIPPWNPRASTCRWEEVKDLYLNLSRRDLLPQPWKEFILRRVADLPNRAAPGDRLHPVRVENGAIIPLCMDPMFEDILIGSESDVRTALGVRGRMVRDWPRGGWGSGSVRSPDVEVLQRAIVSARRVRPLPSPLKQIRGDMRDSKHEWAEYLLRSMGSTSLGRQRLTGHPIVRRLKEACSR